MNTIRLVSAFRSQLTLLFAALSVMACSQDTISSSTDLETREMFFKSKKSAATPNTINTKLGAGFVAIDGMPDLSQATATQDHNLSCQRTRVDAVTKGTALHLDTEVATSHSAFLLTGGLDDTSLAIVNNAADGRFEIWSLAPGDNQRLERRITAAPLAPDQDTWADFSALDAACLPDGRVVLAVNYYQKGAKDALYMFDPQELRFTLISEIHKYVGSVGQYFECRGVTADSALLIYYTDRIRAAPEIYHNQYNRMILFSPSQRSGLEVAALGIDSGNVLDWAVLDQTLYLHTLDRRDASNHKTAFWSLDLSAVLDG